MRVFVYFNLHRKLFSIKAMEGPHKGKVIAHNEDVILYDATFKVSEAGRQRVIREKKKNVHAGVVGYWYPSSFDYRRARDMLNMGVPITYNPYKYSSFVTLVGGDKVRMARKVALFAENKRGYIMAEQPLL